jgi:hypothetical protein
VLSLPALVAPTKVLIVPLSAKEEFDPLVAEVGQYPPGNICVVVIMAYLRTTAAKLRKAGVFSRVDDSNTSIGKRYARNDELGTPYGVTLDFACKLGCSRHQFSSLPFLETSLPVSFLSPFPASIQSSPPFIFPRISPQTDVSRFRRLLTNSTARAHPFPKTPPLAWGSRPF